MVTFLEGELLDGDFVESNNRRFFTGDMNDESMGRLSDFDLIVER